MVQNETRGKREIREAFWLLYKDKRIEKITVREICEKAGYNRSTFYKYYKDVYQILDEIEDNVISFEEFHSQIINRVLSETSNENMLVFIIEFFNTKKEFLPFLLGEKGDPGFRKKIIHNLWKGIEEQMAANLDEFQMVRLRFLIEYQLNAVLSIISYWQSETNLELNKFMEIVLRLSKNGASHELKNILSV